MPAIPTPFNQVPPTKADLEWADLRTIDLSVIDQPGGKEELAAQMTDAMQHHGFIYVRNFGLSNEAVDSQFAIAKAFFDQPIEQKIAYYNEKHFASGNSVGYRPTTIRGPIKGIPDNIQMYNIPKMDGHHIHTHPPAISSSLAEIEKFTRDCHTKILFPLLRILAHVLHLPEPNHLVKLHNYDDRGECHLRYMHYAHRTPAENAVHGDIYGAGHTDLGTITLLFRQPVAALQICNAEGQWKWVKPQDEAVVVNICDALSAMTGGYLKSTVHRIHAPPGDQAHLDRIGVLLLTRANDDTLLDPIHESPLLQRLGLISNEFTRSGVRMTMGEYVRARQAQHNNRPTPSNIVQETGEYEWTEKEKEFAPGLHVKYYN